MSDQAPKPDTAPLPPPTPAEHEAFFGAHVQRTMTLLATSSPERRWPVRVLIYGQSITGSKALTDLIEKDLRTRFPDADLTLENRSIGGFGASWLVHTCHHDLYPVYPDLLIFHDYQGEKTGELERMIANVRRYTTSEILLFTHHRSQSAPGPLEAPSRYRRYLAQKYDCELADVCPEWEQYLAANHIPLSRLLSDVVHPNAEGNAVLSALICRHLRFNPLFPSNWMNTVRLYEARRAMDEAANDEITFSGKPWHNSAAGCAIGESADGRLKLTFTGNRVTALLGGLEEGMKPGTARVLIDGKPPSEHSGLYAITRPSAGVGTWFPAIRRVRCERHPLAEDWTLHVTEISDDQKQFRYEVKGSKTGPDGSGGSDALFVSHSGRVVIDPRDIMFAEVLRVFKNKTPTGFEVHWSVVPTHTDTLTMKPGDYPAHVTEIVLAQGLSNAGHTLEIIPNGDGAAAIEAVQVYQPPLK